MQHLYKQLSMLIVVLLTCLAMAGCGGGGASVNQATPPPNPTTFSNQGMKNIKELQLKVKENKVVSLSNTNPTTFRGAKPLPRKPFTLMVYMCGTDLEEQNGCASMDLMEMAASQFKGENLNVVILTGGTRKWAIRGIDQGCNIYTLEGETLVHQASFGNQLLSSPDTLTTFVNYATTIYPANKYGLVFWNHGGGPVWAYGADQYAPKNKRSIYIPELHQALAKSNLAKKKAEFIGFDACLMATAETAQQLQSYGKYMVASEEAEPGFGWDWRWIRTLSENPDKDIVPTLKEIVDRFVYYCEAASYANRQRFPGTLSIIDLSKANQVAACLNNMGVATMSIFSSQQKAISFERSRANTKSFGDMGRDGNFDLIDIGDYAAKLSSMFPEQAKDLTIAIQTAVVYESHSNSISRATGLTTYSPYNASAKEASVTYKGYETLYKNVKTISGHTNFLTRLGQCIAPAASVSYGSSQRRSTAPTKAVKGGMEATLPADALAQAIDARFVLWREAEPGSDYFLRLLLDKNVSLEQGKYSAKFDGKLLSFQDEFPYIREKDRSEKGNWVLYDTPAYLNDVKVRLLIRKDADHKEGRIMGALRVEGPEDSKLASKEILEVKKGDKLQFRYWANLWTKPGDESKYAGQPTSKWIKGKELTVGDSLDLKLKSVGKELYLATFWITEMDANFQRTDYYTQKLEMRRK